MLDFNIKDLETQGWVVVKNFLSSTDIDRLLVDYKTQRDYSSNIIKIKDNTLLKSSEHGLENKIIPIIELIVRSTDIQLDLLGPNGIYFDTTLAELSWHQDHESYYTWQTGYHQVNFWIPLIKPNPTVSGLKVISMDVLRSKIGSLFEERILDKGAKRFFPNGSNTHVIDDETGDEFDLPINIDSIADAPGLSSGDLLMVRGDVLHTTQDNLSHRVTLAIRAVDGNRYIQKQQFFNQCKMKKYVLDSNFHSTKQINDQFGSNNDQVLIHDVFKGRIQKEK